MPEERLGAPGGRTGWAFRPAPGGSVWVLIADSLVYSVTYRGPSGSRVANDGIRVGEGLDRIENRLGPLDCHPFRMLGGRPFRSPGFYLIEPGDLARIVETSDDTVTAHGWRQTEYMEGAYVLNGVRPSEALANPARTKVADRLVAEHGLSLDEAAVIVRGEYGGLGDSLSARGVTDQQLSDLVEDLPSELPECHMANLLTNAEQRWKLLELRHE